jgi:enoyl-CoA hydratase
MTGAAADCVLVEDHHATRVIRINRPHVKNAIDFDTAQRIEQAVDEFEQRRDLRVLILTGSHEVFCSGMDLNAFVRGERPSTAKRGFAGFVEMPTAKPTIAAVDGPAVGGGFEIALACDLIVAGETATFGLPEVRRGLVAGGGGLLRLPERVPLGRALQLALTGERISAAVAERWGLLNAVVPAGAALEEAIRLASLIAANGPLAVAASKQILRASSHWPPQDSFSNQRSISEPVRASQDAMEGARAFLERREPVWNGC